MAASTDPVGETARQGEPDRYLAALYAPEPARALLLALAAFAADLARIVAAVREPMLAEIRLQWWRDAFAAALRGVRTGHPAADRLAPQIASGLLPVGLLLGMVDAARMPDPATFAADPQALAIHLNKSQGAPFMLAARALGARHSEGLEAACQHSGFTYGVSRLLAISPPLPPAQVADLVTQARAALPAALAAASRLDSALLPAFLPLTMAELYLRQAERPEFAAGSLPLRRWWRLWQANLRGRLI